MEIKETLLTILVVMLALEVYNTSGVIELAKIVGTGLLLTAIIFGARKLAFKLVMKGFEIAYNQQEGSNTSLEVYAELKEILANKKLSKDEFQKEIKKEGNFVNFVQMGNTLIFEGAKSKYEYKAEFNKNLSVLFLRKDKTKEFEEVWRK